MTESIFITYRSCDEPFAALYLEERLTEQFGSGAVFRDSRAIALGSYFPDRISQALQHCRALIAVIGRCWLCQGPDGRRRIDHPRDYVRYEIATALQRDIRVMPVLVGEVSLPTARTLPSDVAGLAHRQYLHLRFRSAQETVARLVAELRPVLGTGRSRASAQPSANPQPAGAATTSHHFHASVDARHSVLGIGYYTG